MLGIDELIVFNVESTADWRRQTAEKFPDDNRNVEAADILERLAPQLRALEGSALHERLAQLAERDADGRFSSILSELLRTVGFHSFPDSGDELMVRLIDLLALSEPADLPRAGTSPMMIVVDSGFPTETILPGADASDSGTSLRIPDQSLAPVRVEERSGRVSLVSDRDSPLSVIDADFNGWRQPIVDHIQELLSGDFRIGTNHSRARDRLDALSTLFVGGISDVKERQFHIGYQIERLEGLVVAYRSGADDMPVLNAAVLEDLDRLRIALMMGIGKLERWSEFRRVADTDPLREGSASAAVVGAAIDEIAAKMEAQPKYFDPELPQAFRFMAEAAKDPVGATKTVIFGSVKSAENLAAFLGQRALGIGRNAADAIEQHISKAVATSLIEPLSGAALQISAALPTAWAWLRPLLDTLAKGSGG